MTNGVAIFLGLVITAVLVYDGLFYEWQVFTFVMRKFLDLTEYIAFWR
ncbi:hypothetical protein [Yoonia sp.]|nr:hypothetical protein [Loktanella sp.]